MPHNMQLARSNLHISRRLSDRILTAFDQACGTGEFKIARELLGTLEVLFEHLPSQTGQERRKNVESLVGAHYRLFACRTTETKAAA